MYSFLLSKLSQCPFIFLSHDPNLQVCFVHLFIHVKTTMQIHIQGYMYVFQCIEYKSQMSEMQNEMEFHFFCSLLQAPNSAEATLQLNLGRNHVHLTVRLGFVTHHLWLGNFAKCNRGLRAQTLQLRYPNSSVSSPLS